MTNLSTISHNRLLQHQLRQTGRKLKAATIYALMAIAMAYTAVVMLAIAIIGVIATPILSIASLVLSPIGDSIFPKP